MHAFANFAIHHELKNRAQIFRKTKLFIIHSYHSDNENPKVAFFAPKAGIECCVYCTIRSKCDVTKFLLLHFFYIFPENYSVGQLEIFTAYCYKQFPFIKKKNSLEFFFFFYTIFSFFPITLRVKSKNFDLSYLENGLEVSSKISHSVLYQQNKHPTKF